MRVQLTIILIAAALSPSCKKETNPAPPVDDVSVLGVYGKYSYGLSEFDTYDGERSGGQFVGNPEGSKAGTEVPEYYVLYLPEAAASASKIYWFDSAAALTTARWGLDREPRALQTFVQDLGDGKFKVWAPELSARVTQARLHPRDGTVGYVALYVRMPLGTPDRLYVQSLVAMGQ